MVMTIDPFEGIPDLAGGSWAKHPTPKGNDKANGKKHTVIAAHSGYITSVGGPFNEIVITHPDGTFSRTCEHAIILVKKGDWVDIFQPIARDALYRQDQYKGTHINAGDSKTRGEFGSIITHTQAEARKIIDGNNTKSTERKITSKIANVRIKPTRSSSIIGKINGNDVISPFGFVYGEIIGDNALWYVMSIDELGFPNSYTHSSVTTDTSPHDLHQMWERPETIAPIENPIVIPVDETPVIVEPPVIVVPPVIETPEIDPPKNGDTPPQKDEPIVNVDNSKFEEIIGKIADLINATLPPAQRKKLYEIMTVVQVVAIPVYSLGVTLAIAIGGKIGGIIGVVTGVLGLVNTGLGILTNRLAKANVNL